MKDNQHLGREITKDEMQKLHHVEIELLQELDRLCRKHGIRYSLDGGTLLGAVRNSKFIPWDDDVDVLMLHEDYLAFRKICQKELDSSRFYFQDMETTPGYRWGYGKLRKKHTKFIREYQEQFPYEQGIFIDIFTMEKVPNYLVLRWVYCVVRFCYRKLFWSAVGQNAERGIVKRFVYRLLAKVPEKFIKDSYQKFIAHCNRLNSQWVEYPSFPSCNFQCGYPLRLFLETEMIEFEGHHYQAICQRHEFLERLYGKDFMIPPPADQQTYSRLAYLEFEDKNNI